MDPAIIQPIAHLDMAQLLALAAALGWASGVRLYLVTFILGVLIWGNWLPFASPASLQILAHPAVLAASFAMLCLEFLADKVPGLDSLWDGIHAFIRIPAGAALAAGVFGADQSSMAMVSALLGGSLAATAYATKATTRLAANTSPEPLSNWGLSFLEDGLVVFMLWLALEYPIAFALCMVLLVLLSVYVLVLLWRFLRQVLRRLAAFFTPNATRDDALG